APARQHVADPVEPQRNRDLARHHADDRDRDRVRRHLLPAFDEEIVVLPFADVDPAAAAADDHAGIRLADAQSGLGPRFARRDDADQRRTRIPLRIRAVAVVPDVVTLETRHVANGDAGHRRRDAAAEVAGVEFSDRARAAAAAAHRSPELFPSNAERRDGADAGDGDAGAAGVTHGRYSSADVARAFVWTGGALFVIALMWCAWWYLFEAGRPLPYTGPGAIAIDACLFSVFALHHSVFARATAKRWLD